MADKKYLSEQCTISNMLTLSRFFLIPCIVISMYLQSWGLACSLFSVAAFTDVIDGPLARMRNEQTALGSYLDPLADKLMMLSCYATLACIESPLFKIPLWFLALVLGKELLLVTGAGVLSLGYKVVDIKPSLLGKGAAIVQVCFIWSLFLGAYLQCMPAWIVHGFLAIILALMAGTLFQYAYRGYKGLYYHA